MKQKLVAAFMLLTLLGIYNQSYSQVKGVGYTISPIGERVWWDKKAGFKDGFMAGGQFGFSFGEYVELRGLYLQGLNMKRDFSQYNVLSEHLEHLDVSLTRWGGDLKLNLSRGALLPYLTVGTGVQTTQLGEFDKNKQIYFSGGLGVMLSVGDRYTLGLQALRTSFRDNPVNNLMTTEERTLTGLNGADFDYRSMNNWSARASLLFYLGGRRPSQLSEIDKAYMDTFSSGLKGISLPIEPIVGKFDWADDLPYKSTNFGGLATGFDFGPLLGVRAYYLRSFDDKLFSEFDKLEVWGGEGKFKLASSGGLIPFLTAGGGRINVLDGYENADYKPSVGDTTGIAGRGFASGGGGFDLALSRHVKLSAFARAMLTSSNKSVVENISTPDELSTSWLYGASLNFIIGKKPETPNRVNNANDSYDTIIRADLEKEKKNTRTLRNQYQQRLEKLDKEIEEAYNKNDSDQMAQKYEEQESLRKMISKLDNVLKKEKDANEGTDIPRMNPSEMRSLVEEIKQSQRRNEDNIKQSLEVQSLKNELQIEKINLRIQAMEESLKNTPAKENQNDEVSALRKELSDLRKNHFTSKERDEIQNLRKELEALRKKPEVKDDKSSELDDLKKQIEEMKSSEENKDKSELEALRKEIEDIKKGADTPQEPKELDALRKEIDDLKKGKSSDKSKASENNKELDDLRKELNDLKKKGDSKEAKASEKTSEFEDLKKELEELKSNSKSSDSNLKKETPKDTDDGDGNITHHTLPDGRTYGVGGYTYISDAQRLHKSSLNEGTLGFFGKLFYEGASALVGLSLGGDPTFNVGLRQHYRFKTSNFFLMPETFFGFGSPASFGIFANGLYQFKGKEAASIEPYMGLGLGFMQVGEKGDQKLKGATNIILGANLFRLGGGRFYADLSARNFFRHNQLALGYRLPF